MNHQLRALHYWAGLLLLLTASQRLAAQPAPLFTDDDDDTITSYSFPMLRMSKGAFTDFGAQGIRSTLTLNNVGDGRLVIQSLEWENSSNDYSFPSPPSLPLIIESGAQQQLEVLYQGSNDIDKLPHAMLNVRSNSRPPTEFAVVLDVSRSMILDSAQCNGRWFTKLEIAKAQTRQFLDSAILFIPELGIQDRLSFSTYSRDITRHFALTEVTDALRAKAESIIDTINVLSSTWTGNSLYQLIDYSYWTPSLPHAIILITDGQATKEDQMLYPPSRVVELAQRERISIYAVSITPKDSAITLYLDSLTIPTGGVTTVADNCTRLGKALSILSAASHSITLDREPFPTGQTLSAPTGEERKESSVAITGITPNPGSDQVTITVRTEKVSSAELLFYNAQGEQVGAAVSEEISGIGERNLVVDVSNFPAGVYVAVLNAADGSQASKRFTVVR